VKTAKRVADVALIIGLGALVLWVIFNLPLEVFHR
jgi:hypothetical protein